jgi:hypothetical protein
VHGHNFYHRGVFWIKGFPIDAPVSSLVADMMGDEYAFHALFVQPTQFGAHFFQGRRMQNFTP